MEKAGFHDISWADGISLVKSAVNFLFGRNFLIILLTELSLSLDDVCDSFEDAHPRLAVIGTLLADDVIELSATFILAHNTIPAISGVPGLKLVDKVLEVEVQIFPLGLGLNSKIVADVVHDELCSADNFK